MTTAGLGTWIHRRRVKSGSVTAIVFEGRELTYRQLADRVDALAVALAARGVVPGTRVAYLGENHPSFLETLFAVTTLGGIFVPLNTRLAIPELQFAVQDSGAALLIHSSALAHAAAACLPVGQRILADDAEVDGDGALALDALIAADLGSAAVPVPVSADDPALILYTSGTTGRPKGAVLTHGNITWNCLNVLVDYDLVSTDIALMISPLFHVASLGMGALPALLKGATVVLEAKFDPARVLELIERHRITWISGVPTTYQLLAEHPDWASRDLSSLQKLTCGGSPVPLRVLEAYEQRGLSFTGGYGMTETAPGATSLQPSFSRSHAGSAGLPHFFTNVRVVDSEGRAVSVGEVGEIQVAGPNVIREYWNRPDETTDAFADGVWFRSGDLGFVDAEGFLTVSDRLKDMVISGGENIYPAEIEAILLELDAVGAAAVIGVPSETWGEVPWAVIELREGFQLDAVEVLGHLDGRLARYKIPKGVGFVTEMPRTASGKIRKAELREQHRNGLLGFTEGRA